MAELPTIEPNRAMLNQAPGSAARPVQPSQVQRVALKAASNYEGTVSEVLDRLSQTLGTLNREFAKEAGYQYAADNPLTPEQLEAIAKLVYNTAAAVNRNADICTRNFELIAKANNSVVDALDKSDEADWWKQGGGTDAESNPDIPAAG